MREGKAIIILLEGRRTSKTFKCTQYQFTGLLGSAGVCYISHRCTCKATELLLCFMAQFGFTHCLALWNIWEKVLNVPRPELCLLLQSRTHFTFVAALTVIISPSSDGEGGGKESHLRVRRAEFAITPCCCCRPLGSCSKTACKWCWRLNCPKPLGVCNDAPVVFTDNLETNLCS